MPATLQNFKVVGLHGRKTIDAHLQSNRLILIGENGSGKSTLANLIYYTLTKQWERLREYRFTSIHLKINGEEYSFTSDQLNRHLHRETRYRVPREIENRLERYLNRASVEKVQQLIDNPDSLRLEARQLGVPAGVLRDMAVVFRGTPTESDEIEAISKQLSSIVKEQFLYLPTYRRIEHDLQQIFRGGAVDIDELRESLTQEGSDAFIELVHFGMEDVTQKIQQHMNQLKESLRTGLDNLTGTYLREVIQGAHLNAVTEIKQSDLGTLDSIFTRIPDQTLPQAYKNRVKEQVSSIGATSLDPTIAHFLLKLFSLHKEQQEQEKSIREFVAVCNVYLTGKKLIYDNVNYNIVIQLTTDEVGVTVSDPGTLTLRMLSSGEKQIVSLFSHVYLSAGRRFFVVIDEPELSLSIIWQRRFLPDIIASGRCDGMVAVTHSPFIWQNELENCVRSVAELTVPINGVR